MNQKHGSPETMSTWKLVAIGIVLTLGFATFVATAGYLLDTVMDPPLDPSEPTYTRFVLVIFDPTKSLPEETRREMKRLAESHVLERIGPGDRIEFYLIDSDPDRYDETKNNLFRGSQLGAPPTYPNLLGLDPTGLSDDNRAQLAALWAPMEELQREWRERVRATESPVDDCCSGYLTAVRYTGERLRLERAIDERILMIVGDLQEEPYSDFTVLPDVLEGEEKAFLGVDVVLVRPSGAVNQHRRDELDEFWRTYFEERGTRSITLESLNSSWALEPNRTPRPVGSDFPTSLGPLPGER